MIEKLDKRFYFKKSATTKRVALRNYLVSFVRISEITDSSISKFLTIGV